MERLLTFGQYLSEAKLFEIDTENNESSVKVNGVELRTIVTYWGDQPDLGFADIKSDPSLTEIAAAVAAGAAGGSPGLVPYAAAAAVAAGADVSGAAAAFRAGATTSVSGVWKCTRYAAPAPRATPSATRPGRPTARRSRGPPGGGRCDA